MGCVGCVGGCPGLGAPQSAPAAAQAACLACTCKPLRVSRTTLAFLGRLLNLTLDESDVLCKHLLKFFFKIRKPRPLALSNTALPSTVSSSVLDFPR